MRRLSESTKIVNHIVPASRTVAAVSGTGIDTSGYDGALVTLVLGDIGASTTLDMILEESDVVGSGYVAVTGAAITQLGATDDNKAPSIDIRLGGRANRKKYLRATATVGGSNAAVYGVVVQLYGAENEPQTQTVAAVNV